MTIHTSKNNEMNEIKGKGKEARDNNAANQPDTRSANARESITRQEKEKKHRLNKHK